MLEKYAQAQAAVVRAILVVDEAPGQTAPKRAIEITIGQDDHGDQRSEIYQANSDRQSCPILFGRDQVNEQGQFEERELEDIHAIRNIAKKSVQRSASRAHLNAGAKKNDQREYQQSRGKVECRFVRCGRESA